MRWCGGRTLRIDARDRQRRQFGRAKYPGALFLLNVERISKLG
jgi:hypothetical protein